VLARVKEDAAVPAELGLRGKGLAHREGVDGPRRERSGDVRGRHLDDLQILRFHAELLEDANDDETLFVKAAGHRDRASLEIRERLDGTVLPHDDRAAVAVPKGDDAN